MTDVSQTLRLCVYSFCLFVVIIFKIVFRAAVVHGEIKLCILDCMTARRLEVF